MTPCAGGGVYSRNSVKVTLQGENFDRMAWPFDNTTVFAAHMFRDNTAILGGAMYLENTPLVAEKVMSGTDTKITVVSSVGGEWCPHLDSIQCLHACMLRQLVAHNGVVYSAAWLIAVTRPGKCTCSAAAVMSSSRSSSMIYIIIPLTVRYCRA